MWAWRFAIRRNDSSLVFFKHVYKMKLGFYLLSTLIKRDIAGELVLSPYIGIFAIQILFGFGTRKKTMLHFLFITVYFFLELQSCKFITALMLTV
jgi:hypothetical protein